MPAPYLQAASGSIRRASPTATAYPFCLPFLRDGFELSFDRPITIIVGENGTGKSTLLEGIAVLAGYDEAGGGKGYMPVDHSNAIEAMGGDLSNALRASWLPKITNGWFFRAESFFSVARYLDEAARIARAAAGFPLAFARRGLSALLRGALPAAGHLHLRRTGIGAVAGAPDGISEAAAADGADPTICQVIMATHSPMLMAYPGARAAAADEIRAGAGDRRADRPLSG